MKRPTFPLDRCPDREMIKMLWYGELDQDVEWRGWVKGHLLACDSCAATYADIVHQALQPETVPTYAEKVLIDDGVFSWTAIHWTIQQPVEMAHKAAPDDYHYIKTIPDRLLTTHMPMATTPPPAWQTMSAHLHLGVNDHPGLPLHLTGGEILWVEPTTPPRITAAGEFQLAVRTQDTRVIGQQLHCLLNVGDGDYVAFDDALFVAAENGYHTAIVIATDIPVSGEATYPIAIASIHLKLKLKPGNDV